MLVSELIESLQFYHNRHGDMPIVTHDENKIIDVRIGRHVPINKKREKEALYLFGDRE